MDKKIESNTLQNVAVEIFEENPLDPVLGGNFS